MIRWLLFLFAGPVFAANIDYKPLYLATHKGDQLLIRGFDGSVKLNAGQSNQVSVRVRQETLEPMSKAESEFADEWGFSMQRRGEVIELIAKGPESKSAWGAGVRAVKFHLDIQAPPMTSQIVWRNGSIKVDGWNAPLRIQSQDGEILVSGGEGDLTVTSAGGSGIKVSKREGRMSADVYNGKVLFDQVKGHVDVDNFSGDTTLLQTSGVIALTTQKGKVNIKKGEGRIDFTNARADIAIDEFAGDLKGQNGGGSVVARLFKDASVKIISRDGPVSLHLPDSGARVDLSTEEGFINAPSSLSSAQRGNLKVVRGELSGSGKGSVVVRTDSGTIRLRQ